MIVDENSIIDFNGLQFLDELEITANTSGIAGVIEMVKKKFPLGKHINMNQGIKDEPVFSIERVVIWNLDTEKEVFYFGDQVVDSIIRSIKLSYGTLPVQIDVYGKIANSTEFML